MMEERPSLSFRIEDEKYNLRESLKNIHEKRMKESQKRSMRNLNMEDSGMQFDN